MTKHRQEIDMGRLGALKGRGYTYAMIAKDLGTTVAVVEHRLVELGLVSTRAHQHEEDPDKVRTWIEAMPWLEGEG